MVWAGCINTGMGMGQSRKGRGLVKVVITQCDKRGRVGPGRTVEKDLGGVRLG